MAWLDIFTLLIVLTVPVQPEESQREGRADSYLDAYANSHAGSGPLGPDFTASGGPSSFYDSPSGPSPSYNEPPGPSPVYNDPAPLYRGPRRPHHPPSPSYSGPRGPSSSYNGPNGHHSYGPEETPFLPFEPEYGVPHSTPFSILDLDVPTMLKILLKTLIFKLIVKFIAVICLLLFLPKLKHSNSSNNNGSNCNSNDDDDRNQARNQRLDALTSLVWQSVDTNSTFYEGACKNDLRCRLRQVSDAIDSQATFPRLFSLFLHERINDERPIKQEEKPSSSDTISR